MSRGLEIAPGPHIHSAARVDRMMLHVVLALLPVSVYAVFAFGWAALVGLSTAVFSCLVTEWLISRGAKSTPNSILGDGSALITGLLFGLSLPSGLPLWMVAVGGVVCIGVGKQLFGGLGYNVFNPALVGRAFLQSAFPVAMTHWLPAFEAKRFEVLASPVLTLPLMRPQFDGLTSATPLSIWKFEQQLTDSRSLLLGLTGGSIGEISAALILLGGAWMLWHRVIDWRIPLSISGSVALLGLGLSHLDAQLCPSVPFLLLSGGLMLGAVFMATDPVGSPMTHKGCWIYGGLIGALVVVIRLWAGLPEGVMFAVLLGNASTPLLDRWLRPRVFGTVGSKVRAS